MITLSVVNQKGGVGKTTTAVTLGHGLARRGERVLLVDLDAQGNVSDLLGMEKGEGVWRLLVDGVVEATASGRDRLDVVAGGKRTAEAKGVLMGRSFREYTVRNGLDYIGSCQQYDWVILDVEPGVGVLQVCALVASDCFIVPCSLADLSVGGVVDVLESVATLRQVEATKAQFLGVLPTFWERATLESIRQLVGLSDEFEGRVWPPIPQDVKAREAPAFGKTLWEYAPACRALRGIEVNGTGLKGGYEQALERLVREVGR